jgi:segregation and condensation protein B
VSETNGGVPTDGRADGSAPLTGAPDVPVRTEGEDRVEPAQTASVAPTDERADESAPLTGAPDVPACTEGEDPEPVESESGLATDECTVDDAPVTAAPDVPTCAEGEDRVEPDPAPQVSRELKSILEALIFASPEPITLSAIFKLLASEPREEVAAALAALREDYASRGGLQLVEIANGFQIVTRPELHEWVSRLFRDRASQRLTVQALEALAVVAYKQPITAVEVSEIRGVNTSGVMTTLLERRLIRIVGRKQVVGRPFLYATTKEFLIRFGLKDLGELPKVEDVAEALGFEPPALLGERTPTEEMLPLEDADPRGPEPS